MWDNVIVKVLVNLVGVGSSAGLTVVTAFLLVRAYDRWVANRRRNKSAESEVKATEAKIDFGTADQWRKFAQFTQRRLDDLRKELDKVYVELAETRNQEQSLKRQVNALRIRCDRYEEAMRQVNIPFDPYDSSEFD